MKKNTPSKMSNSQSLRVLIVEDSDDDVLLIIRELNKGGYNPVYERAETVSAMKKALKEKQWDIILCDYKMPKFNAPSAIAVLKEANIDIPLIVVTGAIGEEAAVECMRLGAQDYIMKGNMFRLCPAITRELEESEVRKKQRQAEEALRESEYKYKSLIENIPGIILTIDLEGTITFVSKRTKEILGYENAEMINMAIFNFIPEEDHQRTMESLQRGMKGEKIKHFQIPMIAKSGEKVFFESSFTRIYKDGAVVGAQGTAVDITERKEAEEMLKESEIKYRLLAYNIHDVIFVMDMNLNYTYLSPSVKILRGYEPEEALKQTPAETLTPSSLDLAIRTLSEIMEIEKSEHREISISRTLQLEMSRKDGTTVWVETKASFVRDENQRAIGIMGLTRDITERKQAEEMLRQSEENFRRSLEDSPLGVRIVTVEGEIIYANQAILDMYGYDSMEELKTTPVENRYTPESFAEHQIRKEKRKRGDDTPSEYDIDILRKDGEVRHLHVFRKDILWDGERQFQVIYQDITERKRTEDVLRISEERYRIAESIGHIGNWEYNLKTTKFWGSDETKRIYGFDPEALDFSTGEVEKCITERERVHQALVDLIEADKPYNLEFEIHPKNSLKPRIISSIAELKRDEHGNLLLVTGVIQDITERKRMEEALHAANMYDRSLIEASLDPLVTIGSDGKITDVNAATEAVTGYTRAELIGAEFSDYFTEPEQARAGYQEVFREGFVRDHPLELRHRDGHVTSVLYNASVYRNEKEQVEGVFAAARDITKRKQAEAQLHASLREKELLLSEVHHRVKNNMQVISGLLDLPAALSGNQERRKMFHESQSRIHAMSLVHEKLYGSKDFARIDLAAYVKTLSQDLFQTYKIHPGKIDLIIQTDGDVYVDINKAIPCGLILNELISNALKHAFPGDRHSELQIIIRGMKNTEIEIVIRDNGLGLPDDVDIHQPLSVGLYLVKGLVKSQLDGKMEVRRDAGTEVRIKFPL